MDLWLYVCTVCTCVTIHDDDLRLKNKPPTPPHPILPPFCLPAPFRDYVCTNVNKYIYIYILSFFYVYSEMPSFKKALNWFIKGQDHRGEDGDRKTTPLLLDPKADKGGEKALRAWEFMIGNVANNFSTS